MRMQAGVAAASLEPLFCNDILLFFMDCIMLEVKFDRLQITRVLNITTVTCIIYQLDCSAGTEELALCISESKLNIH